MITDVFKIVCGFYIQAFGGGMKNLCFYKM